MTDPATPDPRDSQGPPPAGLTPSDWREALEIQDGWLWHDCHVDAVVAILRGEDLRPPTPAEIEARWKPILRPRPNKVYFHTVKKNVPIRVRLEDIEPERLRVEEDALITCVQENRERALCSSYFPLPTHVMRWLTTPDYALQDDVLQSVGEWVESVGQDTSANVLASIRAGSVCVEGAVPRDLIHLNEDHVKVRHARQLNS